MMWKVTQLSICLRECKIDMIAIVILKFLTVVSFLLRFGKVGDILRIGRGEIETRCLPDESRFRHNSTKDSRSGEEKVP